MYVKGLFTEDNFLFCFKYIHWPKTPVLGMYIKNRLNLWISGHFFGIDTKRPPKL